MKKWEVKGSSYVYQSDWVSMRQDHVVLPDGTEIPGHHVVEFPRKAVAIVLLNSEKQVLMIKNYRFIVDFTGWELPAGRMESEETIEEAKRELLEETGYGAKKWEIFLNYYVSNGCSNQEFEVVIGTEPQKVNDFFDTNEVLEMDWFTGEEILEKIKTGEIKDGQVLATIPYCICKGLL
ncbi:NUDIX hydrolase [bacterium]|nr:NUDIX hydrolase [bacterium]